MKILTYSSLAGSCSQSGPSAANGSTSSTSLSSSPISISASVGLGGKNLPADVRTIQSALNEFLPQEGGPQPLLAVDGIVGPKTIAAIRKFQQAQLKFSDGRVDPNGKTIARINEARTSKGKPAHKAQVATGLVLLALADARQCIVAARSTLDLAISAMMRGSGPAGEGALEKCRYHFHHHECPNPLAELIRIRDVFHIMHRQQLDSVDDFDGYFQGKEGTFVADLSGKEVELAPRRFVFAHTTGGGAHINPPQRYKHWLFPDGPYYTTNHVYVMPEDETLLPDEYVRAAIHELAHFCGPISGGDYIDDHGTGWPDAPGLSKTTAPQRCRNADTFASFAFHARYGRRWVHRFGTWVPAAG